VCNNAIITLSKRNIAFPKRNIAGNKILNARNKYNIADI
jgi:hypothetical protein